LSAKELKQQERNVLQNKITGLSKGQRRQEELRIQDILQTLILDLQIHRLLAYRALGDEVNIDGLLEALLSDTSVGSGDQKLLMGFPRINGQDMDFFSVRSWENDWQKGLWDLWEPRSSRAMNIKEGKTLILVPGRGFTPMGHRLGRGGGYYDRFLCRHPRIISLGIAYDCQVVSSLPQDPWDQPLMGVLRPSVDPNELTYYFDK
jgi:5-formyltetrahydrofolate cyclo-ligase